MNLINSEQEILLDKANKYGDFFYNYFINMHDHTIVSFDRLQVIHDISKYVLDNYIDGEIAEIGVYRGGTAKLILQILKHYESGKKLYLFDTFEGLPPCDCTKDLHIEGRFNETSMLSVTDYLKDFNTNYEIIAGVFPGSAHEHHKHQKYSFVHLDVDIYKSYKSALNFFDDKMTKGGIILSDDYNFDSCPGAKKAIDEFYLNKPQIVYKLQTNQCMICY